MFIKISRTVYQKMFKLDKIKCNREKSPDRLLFQTNFSIRESQVEFSRRMKLREIIQYLIRSSSSHREVSCIQSERVLLLLTTGLVTPTITASSTTHLAIVNLYNTKLKRTNKMKISFIYLIFAT